MTKSIVEGRALSNLPYAALREGVRAGLKKWTSVNNALKAAAVESETRGQVLDPFVLLQIVGEVRSDSILLGQVGEASVAEAENWARQQVEIATLAFDGELRKSCVDGGISVEGRLPSYVLEGFLTVRLSLDEGTCMVDGKKIRTLLASRIWPEITSAIKEERLRQSTLDDFLASCQVAYKRAIALRNTKTAASIPIKDLYRELVITLQPASFWRSPQRQHFAEYTEKYFSRDLARLMAAGRFVTADGSSMELMPTAFSKDGIAIMLGDGVRFIGHVTFRDQSL